MALTVKVLQRQKQEGVGPFESVALSFIGSLVLIAIWQITFQLKLLPPRILPSPVEVLTMLARLLTHNYAGYTLPQHLFSSAIRYLLGFGIAAILGVPLGLFMGWSRKCQEIIGPFIEAFRFISPIAWAPFAVLWFGTGIGGPTLIIFSGSFPPCVLNSIIGARLISAPVIEASRSLGAGPWRMLVDVLVPGALPSIVAGLRIAAGIGWQSLVGAELIVASSGVGYLMVQGQANFDTSVVMAGMIAIGITGFGIDVLLRLLESRIKRG